MTSEDEREGFLVAKELIENLFYDMAKLSTKYCNDTFCDLPYLYRERQLDSILLPALSRLCDSMVLAELPAIRHSLSDNTKAEVSSGRIDYWCIYKNYSFVIELKHSYDCFTTSTTTEVASAAWKTMIGQLQSLGKEIRKYEEKTLGVIRIGLHFITSYSDLEPSDLLIDKFNENIPETFSRYKRDLGKPDVLICWKIPARIVMKCGQTYGQSFPALWSVAKIYPPIHHRGARE